MYTAGYTGEDAFGRDLKARMPLGDMVTRITRRLLSLLNGGAYRLRGLGIDVLEGRDTVLRPERLDANIRAR